MTQEERSQIIRERRGAAALIRLNRPDRLNALTDTMFAALRAAIDEDAADADVTGIVITGEGRAFSAGLDSSALVHAASGNPPPEAPSPDDPEADLPALFSYILRVPKPVIAAVNGVAAGGGFVLAMMCDLRFVAEAGNFVTVFSRRGLIAEHGTSWLLPRLVGASRALDLLWSSRKVDAAEALRIGLADRVVPDGTAVEAAIAYLEDLKATVAPRAIATIKDQVYRQLSMGMAPAFHDSDARMRVALAHPDAREGVDSFIERRPPRFSPLTKP
jgi:enoyl-CoA hydratase/carnithine racemase